MTLAGPGAAAVGRAAGRAGAGGGLAFLLLLALVGCGQGTSTSPSRAPGGSATAAPTVTPTAPGSRGPTATPGGSASATATLPPGSASASTGVSIDPALLDHLPAAVKGSTPTADPATAAQIAADPTLGPSASALAVAIVVGSDTNADDLAIANVVQLRPGVFDEAFWTSWRADYDAAACASAGGATGTQASVVGGRAAFIGTCAGGARTYHVHLPGDVLVSVTSVGPADLGTALVAGLR